MILIEVDGDVLQVFKPVAGAVFFAADGELVEAYRIIQLAEGDLESSAPSSPRPAP